MPVKPDPILPWCCVQSGHRERYAIPRALHAAGRLHALVTDVWIPPGTALSRWLGGSLGQRLRDRFHPDLPRHRVRDFSVRSLMWEAQARARRLDENQRVLAHNRWWSATAASALPRRPNLQVFAYSYGAGPLFRIAAERDWVSVLGQIDPGPVEDAKVAALVARWTEYRTGFRPGSSDYYQAWREECRLARHIVVNSEWSRQALEQAGVDSAKIVVCPLVYRPPAEANVFRRQYPRKFDDQRPLRVLFLGQCNLRKGIAEVIAAARNLRPQPMEFTLVGNTDIEDLAGHFGPARVRHVGRVAREQCLDFFRNADVFLFPTHSDGFGLTQLEAQAWQLPLIVSDCCAKVVEHGSTGWVLPEVTSAAIENVLTQLIRRPDLLPRAAGNIQPWAYDEHCLGKQLISLAEGTGDSR